MLAEFTPPFPPDLGAVPRTATVLVRSAEELRRALRQARTGAVRLDGSALDRVLGVDRERGRAEIQAAARWASLAEHPALAPLGLHAFTAEFGAAQTVGESVNVNWAGPDGAPVSRHIAAITLVTPDGELRRADRESNPDLFRLAVGGQGVFGVLYSVTLDLASLVAAAAAAQPPVQLALGDESAAAGSASAIELLVPPLALERFLDAVRTIAAERRVALRHISVRRTLAEDETRLRWARRDWAAVHIRFAARGSLGAAVYAAETRRELLAQALDCGGSFPVRDLRDATRAQLEACYPALGVVLAEKRRADPADRLQNAWLRRARAILREDRCESRWSH
jgi:FAD/FMN-containing dehydrogenase